MFNYTAATAHYVAVAEHTLHWFLFWAVILVVCLVVIVVNGEDFVNHPKLHQD